MARSSARFKCKTELDTMYIVFFRFPCSARGNKAPMQQLHSYTCAGVNTSFRLPSADAQAGRRQSGAAAADGGALRLGVLG